MLLAKCHPPEISENIWSSLFLFTRKRAYVRIKISSNTRSGYTVENQEERLFFNETVLLFWCYALWKLGSSNCCVVSEMKHATGMETCTKVYVLFFSNLVQIRIRKTSLFWPYNLMTSLWKPSIPIYVLIYTPASFLGPRVLSYPLRRAGRREPWVLGTRLSIP